MKNKVIIIDSDGKPIWESELPTGSLPCSGGGSTVIVSSDAPVGTIIAYGGTTIPDGWLLCDGRTVSRSAYSELFAAIGTRFGIGNGSTSFNLPDAREAALVGAGKNTTSDISEHDTYTIGQFKDDQVQDHDHRLEIGSGSGMNAALERVSVGDFSELRTGKVYTPTGFRAGGTTRGKRLGVNYIIKAKMQED